MIYCVKCGQQLQQGSVICPNCGAHIPNQEENAGQQMYEQQSQQEVFHHQDVVQNKWMAVFSYLGWLVLIPILAGRNSRFARYHANQGLVLLCAEIIFRVLRWFLRFTSGWSLLHVGFIDLYDVLGIVRLFFFVIAIIGIVNAVKGETKQLPIIGRIRLIRW